MFDLRGVERKWVKRCEMIEGAAAMVVEGGADGAFSVSLVYMGGDQLISQRRSLLVPAVLFSTTTALSRRADAASVSCARRGNSNTERTTTGRLRLLQPRPHPQ